MTPQVLSGNGPAFADEFLWIWTASRLKRGVPQIDAFQSWCDV